MPSAPDHSEELRDAVVVAFPLRGEGWVAVNSPADRIPSHGVDLLGQRYAFDFLRVDLRRSGLHPHPAGTLRGWLIEVSCVGLLVPVRPVWYHIGG